MNEVTESCKHKLQLVGYITRGSSPSNISSWEERVEKRFQTTPHETVYANRARKHKIPWMLRPELKPIAFTNKLVEKYSQLGTAVYFQNYIAVSLSDKSITAFLSMKRGNQ